MKGIVVCFSGGIDSTVLLYLVKSLGVNFVAVSLDYGQKHRKELAYAQMHVNPLMLKIPNLDGSSLTDDGNDIPEGHYESDNMKSTVVPNRNLILLGLAASVAISKGFDTVAYAAHSGDHAVYPDCRQEFISKVEEVLKVCHYSEIKLFAPFVKINKSQIVSLGCNLGVDFSKTWSCYKGMEKHCGKCGTCVERREAFSLSGVKDPTDYE